MQDTSRRSTSVALSHIALWLESVHRAYRAQSSSTAYMASQALRCAKGSGPVRMRFRF